MPVQTPARSGRRRGVVLLGLLLLMQGPAALTTLQGRALLFVLGLPVLYLANRALAASWCSPDRWVRAVVVSTAVLFASQEAYSGIAVAWVNRDQQTVQSQSAAQIVGQHLLALVLAAVVALIVCGVRAARGYVRALVRLATPGALVVVRRPRVAVALRAVVRKLSVVASHYGLRSPPRCALPC